MLADLPSSIVTTRWQTIREYARNIAHVTEMLKQTAVTVTGK
jgi:hypothetical protein